jgi:hypothetical protein
VGYTIHNYRATTHTTFLEPRRRYNIMKWQKLIIRKQCYKRSLTNIRSSLLLDEARNVCVQSDNVGWRPDVAHGFLISDMPDIELSDRRGDGRTCVAFLTMPPHPYQLYVPPNLPPSRYREIKRPEHEAEKPSTSDDVQIALVSFVFKAWRLSKLEADLLLRTSFLQSVY